MSQVRKETIECPHCHAKGEFDFWESINVDLDPELRDKIFSDELFMFRCPSCGEVTGIPFGTLYHDMRNKFMLFFDFFKPDDYDYSPMDIPEDGFGIKEGYTFRVVFNLMRFKEKIVILEAGLNDIAVERQKYMISHIIMPEIAEKGYQLYFAKREGPNEEFEHGTIYYFYDDEEKQQTMTVRFAMDNYYEHCLACEIDPRMAVNGCICVDEELMAKRMKEE